MNLTQKDIIRIDAKANLQVMSNVLNRILRKCNIFIEVNRFLEQDKNLLINDINSILGYIELVRQILEPEENISVKEMALLYMGQKLKRTEDENKELQLAVDLAIIEIEANYKRLGFQNSNILSQIKLLNKDKINV